LGRTPDDQSNTDKKPDWLLIWTAVGAIAGVVAAIFAVFPAMGVDFREVSAVLLVGIGAGVGGGGAGILLTILTFRRTSSQLTTVGRAYRFGVLFLVTGALLLTIGVGKAAPSEHLVAGPRTSPTPSATSTPPSPTPVSPPPGTSPPPTTSVAGAPDTSCLAMVFKDIAKERVTDLQLTGRDHQLGPAVSDSSARGNLAGDYGVKLLDQNSQFTGAVRVNFNVIGKQYRLDQVVDSTCHAVQPPGATGSGDSVAVGLSNRTVTFRLDDDWTYLSIRAAA
jgi:hypothetical protein